MVWEGGIKYNTGLIMVNCFTKERLFVSSGDLKTDQIEEFMGAKKKKKKYRLSTAEIEK